MKTYLRYTSGVRLFLDYASDYRPRNQGVIVDAEAEVIRARAIADTWDFARAAGDTLSRVNADPRNHFGKHALRRFDR